MTTDSDQRRPRRRLSKRAKVILTALGVVGMSAAVIGPVYAVANGDPVVEGQYRFAVKLTMPKITSPSTGATRSSACSAGLIDAQWIISAGHCFHDGDRNKINGAPHYQIIATVGTSNVASGLGVNVDVVEVHQAPNGADMAIAKLARPVHRVPTMNVAFSPPPAGKKLRIVGFGWNGSPGTSVAPSNQAYTGEVTTLDVTETEIGVAGKEPAPVTGCLYDSGAPYFWEHNGKAQVVSVESDGPTCPHSQRETTARADNHRAWIKGWINGTIG
jgi:secreted trypsin-like serine protease